MHMDPSGVEHEYSTGGQGGQACPPPSDAHCGTDVIMHSGERVSIAPHANDRSVTHRLGDLTRSHPFLEKRRAGEDRVTRSCTVHPSRFGAPIERAVPRGCVVGGRRLRERCGGGSRSGRHRRARFTTPAGRWPTLRIDPSEAPQQRRAGVMRMWDTSLDEMGVGASLAGGAEFAQNSCARPARTARAGGMARLLPSRSSSCRSCAQVHPAGSGTRRNDRTARPPRGGRAVPVGRDYCTSSSTQSKVFVTAFFQLR
ncbi:hypothetical protein SAMN06295909_2311 [Plantibacter sp. VKM Ac-1784]|uniref:Uncharacterized protein n=1 Tax=Plantibacter elymi (nom. nud.) TaxID=199708 RepID=A0ABY1RDD0_9MICO|nr:hypothetical protein SAMN06295909_2311 [Plantibacter sp. VKM Ac-1784]